MNRKERRRQQKMSSRRPGQTSELSPDQHGQLAANLVQASTAMNSGNLALAIQLSDDVLDLSPDHPDALNIKAASLMTSGDLSGAVRLFTKIAGLLPDFAQASFNLGTALNAQGKTKRAISSLTRAIELDPDYGDAHYNLANALRQTDQIKKSLPHYDKTLQINPNHSGAATNLASAHLELGNPDAALTAARTAQISDPGNRDAFSFLAVAATESGNPQLAAEILNPEHLVRPTQINSIPEYIDLAAFNAALIDHVLAHPTLAKEPHNKATRNGQQTDNLALGDRGPVAALQGLIGDALDDYLKAIGSGIEHPYPSMIPPLTKIDIWGTVLGAQGHQAAHMHRAAWVSGVYYAKLPDIMHTGDHGTAGWIEFCRPPDHFKCEAEHAVHLIEPKEGLLVLFPSYVYHRTLPFESDDKRISIAFDLLG